MIQRQLFDLVCYMIHMFDVGILIEGWARHEQERSRMQGCSGSAAASESA